MMKGRVIFLALLLTVTFFPAKSQVIDDFSDGNFLTSPSWVGDTTNFIININNQLQLMAPAFADQSYLSTPCEIIKEAEWSFSVKLEFNPSSSNYMDMYLVSDQVNLKGPLNGYFVRIGNSQDEVSLYKQSGEKSTSEKIIDGTDDRTDSSFVELNIKVTKSASQIWELLVDKESNGNYISEGTVVDGSHEYSKYFGIKCTYTKTRAAKFFFDNLIITGESNVDSDPPSIDSLMVTSDSSLQISFSEAILPSSAFDLKKYMVDSDIGNPYSAELLSDSIVILSFRKKFTNKITHRLSIHGIEDISTNQLDSYSASFTYLAPHMLRFGDVLITEIMADPTPGLDLPEYEYLEIYNPTDHSFNLNLLKLIVGKDTVVIPERIIDPKQYIILCQHSAVEHFENYGQTLKIPNWPSLNNRGENISLYNAEDGLIFSIEYSNAWYRSIEKDDGGWSLEMIDTDFHCKDRENWIASIDPSGGTPGRENASINQLADFSAPDIARIIANSDSSIFVYINEKVEPQEISISNISINPLLEIEKARLASPILNRIDIIFNAPIIAKVRYELTIKNIEDCAGNIQKGTSSYFVLPERADSLDLLINEILFDPRPEGVDFVELYNQSDKFIDLKTIQVGNEDFKTITNDHFIIGPKQFLAITEDPEILNNQYPGLNTKSVWKVDALPPFNNDEGNVILRDEDGKTIDFFSYSGDFHSSFLQDIEGVSLERISFAGPSNSASNWQSAASTANFATPGKMNSQYLASLTESEEVIVDPMVFNPGNNGFHDFTTIKCRFSSPGNMASIKILDASGRSIKTIISHQSIGAQEDFKWEGLDDNGVKVRMGYYIVYLEIFNSSGDRKLYRKKVVVGGRI